MKDLKQILDEIKNNQPTERQCKELVLAVIAETQPALLKVIRSTLKNYDEVYLIHQNGKYDYTIGLTLCSSYPKDYRFYGKIDKSYFNDYTEEELKIAQEKLANCKWF